MKRSILAWFLFAVAVAIPAFFIFALSLNLGHRERERALVRQRESRVAAAASLQRDVELARLRSDEALRGLPLNAPQTALEDKLVKAQSVFAEPYILDAEGKLVFPRDEAALARIAPLVHDNHLRTMAEEAAEAKMRDARAQIAARVAEAHQKTLDALAKAGVIMSPTPRNGGAFVQTRGGDFHYLSSRRSQQGGVEVGYIVTQESFTRGAMATLPESYAIELNPHPEDADSAVYDVQDTEGNKLSVALPKTGPVAAELRATQIVVPPAKMVFRVVDRRPGLSRHLADHESNRVIGFGFFVILLIVVPAAVLFAQKRRADRLANLRTDFVASVSHELRTPLASVRMFAELLEAGAVPPTEREEVEHALAGETRRLGATLERMLRFGSLARGKLVVEKRRVRLEPLLDEAAKRLRSIHPDKEILVDVDPSLEADLDAGLFGLALDNLLNNAAKYAPAGGPYRLGAVRDGAVKGSPYRITGRRDRANVLVSLADSGPGLDRRAQAKVFLPFERDDRLSRATEGTGVGLALVRGIARAHGGDASVTSELGKGATFVLTFPEA